MLNHDWNAERGAVTENTIGYITHHTTALSLLSKGWLCSLSHHSDKKHLVVEKCRVVDVPRTYQCGCVEFIRVIKSDANRGGKPL